jgi:hypothetical protein
VTDLAQLTLERFEPHVGDVFTTTVTVAESGERLELRFVLERAEAVASPPAPEARQPFALRFRLPFATVLPQRIYALRHEQLGTLEIFLVPIGRDGEEAVRYEAVFS